MVWNASAKFEPPLKRPETFTPVTRPLMTASSYCEGLSMVNVKRSPSRAFSALSASFSVATSRVPMGTSAWSAPEATSDGYP